MHRRGGIEKCPAVAHRSPIRNRFVHRFFDNVAFRGNGDIRFDTGCASSNGNPAWGRTDPGPPLRQPIATAGTAPLANQSLLSHQHSQTTLQGTARQANLKHISDVLE
jgi:hypothetical protein